MKKIILCLFLGIGILKAECEVLGLKLNHTSANEIHRKYGLIENENGSYGIDTSKFTFFTSKIKKIQLDFSDFGVVDYIKLDFESSVENYKKLQELLDEKYTNIRDDSIKSGGWFKEEKIYYAYRFYRTKDMKDCEISLTYDPNNKELYIDYLYVVYP